MSTEKLNPIEDAIGERAKPKLSQINLQKIAQDVKKAVIRKVNKEENPGFPLPETSINPSRNHFLEAQQIQTPSSPPSEIPDEPTPTEMLALEELNRQTEERLRDEPEESTTAHPQPTIATPKSPIPASQPDSPPETEICSPESPPQGIRESDEAVEVDKIIREELPEAIAEILDSEEARPAIVAVKKAIENIPPAEDIELTALRKYIFEDGFVVATVAFHVVTLCAQPMVTPSTTSWDFVDRALIPDMVFALLKQPGYLEGIWPSLKIVMGTNKGNAAWCSGICITLAFFDIVRTLPTLKEMKNEIEKKS